MAGLSICLLALLSGLDSIQPPISQSVSEIARRVEREFCVGPEDFGQLEHERHLETLRELGEPGRNALLSVARSRKSVANCALIFLVELGDKRAFPLLRDIVSRPDATRGDLSVALWGLGALPQPESYPLIASFLLEPAPEVPAATAIQALGAIDDDRARNRLRELLADPRFTRQKYAVVRALGRHRDVTSMSAIASILDQAVVPRDFLLVVEGITALVMMRTPDSLGVAREQLKKIGDSDVRERALNSAREALRQELKRTGDPTEQQAIQSLLRELGTWGQQ